MHEEYPMILENTLLFKWFIVALYLKFSGAVYIFYIIKLYHLEINKWYINEECRCTVIAMFNISVAKTMI